MVDIRQCESIGSKTTMRIGGTAKFFAELETKEDVEKAIKFAEEQNIPLIPLGSGSNTIFASDEIDALVVRIKADNRKMIEETDESVTLSIECGQNLAMLLNELAAEGIDLSALTGIPGTLGGAIFGNAGQGPKGIWIDSYIESVTAYIDGEWETLSKEKCEFRYRESGFKDKANVSSIPPLVWSAVLSIPKNNPEAIKAEIERLLQRRIETQPHVKTAGSCFKATADGTPAWKLIDAAGLRGLQIGGIEVSEKHANFLLNKDKGTMDDILAVTEKIQEAVPDIASIEMRLYGNDGKLLEKSLG